MVITCDRIMADVKAGTEVRIVCDVANLGQETMDKISQVIYDAVTADPLLKEAKSFEPVGLSLELSVTIIGRKK